ncbi:MAG: hypothetical protein K0S76_1972 [Herbinix sp.]|jgi:AraC-like DNA-binding protein|nr:hypothetical protein [Herbinix sp.]
MKTNEKGIKKISDVYFCTPSNLALNTFLYVTCTGHYLYEEGYHVQRDKYNSYLIMYIVKGKARINVSGRYNAAKAGDIVYMNCYEPHGYEASEDLETLWFHYDGISAKEYDRALSEYDCSVFTLLDASRAVHYIKKIFENSFKGNRDNEAVISSYICAVLSELFPSLTSYEGGSVNGSTILEDTMRYVTENLNGNLDISVLAKNVSLSEFYFARTFKKVSGYTPHEYVVKARINQAKILLKGTDRPLKKIADECGFSSESGFVTTFKKNTGVTPGEFRKIVL